MTPPSESWFDRLASKPHTRRQGIRAAAIGTAAAVGAGLPFARSLPKASAESDTDCRKGCIYTANRKYGRELVDLGVIGFIKYTKIPILGPAAPLFALVNARQVMRSYDNIVSAHRSEVNVCFTPNCPGFSPTAPGGPCDGCEQPYFCNPCSVLDEGYICCIYSPKDCHGDCCPSTVPPGCP